MVCGVWKCYGHPAILIYQVCYLLWNICPAATMGGLKFLGNYRVMCAPGQKYVDTGASHFKNMDIINMLL